jgi:hypothetical protein
VTFEACQFGAVMEPDGYFVMQHSCCPTRLLDWAEGALIALYWRAEIYRLHDHFLTLR